MEVSQKCLEFSDISLFIFTRTGARRGPPVELAILTTDTSLLNKMQFSIVYDQVIEGKSSLPPLTDSGVKLNDISYRQFERIQELDELLIDSVYKKTVKWAKFQRI